jgi:hypothetical protein
MNKKRPIPEVVGEKKKFSFYSSIASAIVLFFSSTNSGIGLFVFMHNLWYSLFS